MQNRKSLMLQAAEKQSNTYNRILELNEAQSKQVSGGTLGTLIYGMVYSWVTTVDATAGTVTSSMQFFDGLSNPYDIFPEETVEDDPIA